MSDAPIAETTEKTPDLYDVLGVPRDASKADIARAYREKAKTAHPDAPGGSEQAFNKLRMARDVLSNPSWRANYDAAGALPGEEADNAQAHLLTSLTGMFGTAMQLTMKNQEMPSQVDFLGRMTKAIADNFDLTNKQIGQLEKSKLLVQAMEGRFKVKTFEQPNHLQTIVAGQITLIDRQLEQLRITLRQLENARVYLDDVMYERAWG